MSPGRPIIAAAQVIVVGVLIVVVYTNFLRPGDEGSLSGVAAPGGPDVTQSAEPAVDRNGDRGGAGAAARVPAVASVATPTGVGPTVGAPNGLVPASETPDSTGPGPTDDQYLDSVARLTVKLY